MGRNAVVVGLQWGDEGKGKVVDLLARHARYVVRFQGGNNAGHTLMVDGEQLVLHLVPSGILRPDTTCVVGNGVVVGPEVLVSELDALAARGRPVPPAQLAISTEAHVVMPYHRVLDGCREDALGGRKIGTTRRGIGPAYEDKAARRGVRMADFVDPAGLRRALEAVVPEKNRLLTNWYGQAAMDVAGIEAWARPLALRLAPHVRDTTSLLHAACAQGEPVLFEGAQGTFLDVDHGTYPFVTSSNTVAGAACAGSGVGPRDLHQVVGVTKAYTTRVGSGPFPTELTGEAGDLLRACGHEYGATTGRPRRCGWFDAALVRHAVRLNGVTTLALTKLDVLSDLGTLQIAVGYEGHDTLPAGARAMATLRPVYQDIAGWKGDISHCQSWDQLPAPCQAYVERIEELCGVPVGLVSVGPGRDQVLVRDPAMAELLGAAELPG